MDLDEGRRLGLEAPEPTWGIHEDDQLEPWGWRDKRPPLRIRHRLRDYREFVEGLERDDNQ